MPGEIAEILSIGKQLQSLVEALPRSISKWFELLDEIKRRKKASDIGYVVAEIEDRLFTRYQLIYDFEGISESGTLSQDKYDDLIIRLSRRMEYLKEFNEKIPELMVGLGNPELAAKIKDVTSKSIELYAEIIGLENPNKFIEIAPHIVPVLKHIAELLEKSRNMLRN